MTFKMPFVWSYIELWSYARETYNRKNACLPYLKTKFDFFSSYLEIQIEIIHKHLDHLRFLCHLLRGCGNLQFLYMYVKNIDIRILKEKNTWKNRREACKNTINGDICLKYLFYVIKYKCYNSVTYKLIHACTSVCPTFFSSAQTGQRLINTQNM